MKYGNSDLTAALAALEAAETSTAKYTCN